MDLDPGVNVVLRWMRRRRTLPPASPPTRLVVIRRVGVVGILAMWVILHKVTQGTVPWLW